MSGEGVGDVDYDRVRIVRDALNAFVKSPSLEHVRDAGMLQDLAVDIVRRLFRADPIWRKWDLTRDAFLREASLCWAPVEDLRDFLNGIPGPVLTASDVSQRLRAMHEEPYAAYPNADLQAGCLEVYAAENLAGTEMRAIVGVLGEYIEREEERIRQERAAAHKIHLEEERRAAEQLFLSGAECKWTPVARSRELYCRTNGRAFRLAPTADRKWSLSRITSVDDPGRLIGTYARRGDASKALVELANRRE